MIDRGGHARLAILAPPWAVRRKYAPGIMIVTRHMSPPFASHAFSFGAVAVEVRPVYLVAYNVGGGEMNNLSSTQGFCRKPSVQ